MKIFNRHITEPTYTKDIVGPIERLDERDIVFARHDLFRYFGPQTAEHQSYYAAHPEYLDYDSKISKMPGLGRTGGIDVPMFKAQFAAMDIISPDTFVDGIPADGQATIAPERSAEKVKAMAHVLGAGLVKIGPLRQEWTYSHVGRTYGNREGFQMWGTPIDLSQHPHAIAMGFSMDYNLIQCAPDFPVLLATAKGYAQGAWVAVQLAGYIRMLGYSARAHHFHNYQVIAVPVAVDCGLGELSRAGYLITKEFGLGVRLAIVTTDMPLVHDQPVDIGVQSFCETCKICAEQCPIGAIPKGDKVEYNGIKKWKLDEEKCYSYWNAIGTDCGVCMASCPWTKPRTWPHKLAAEFASVKGPHQSLMVYADKLVYGKHQSAPRPDFIDPFKSK